MKKEELLTILLSILSIITIVGIILFMNFRRSSLTIQDFDNVIEDYQTVATCVIAYYSDNYPGTETLCLLVKDNSLVDGNTGEALPLNDTEKQSLSVQCITKRNGDHPFQYDFLWVTPNEVIFWEDETKMYGILYTKNASASKKELRSTLYDSMEFHKIQRDWFEIGCFGI